MSTTQEDSTKNTETSFSFPQEELKVLNFWEKEKIFEKSLEKNESKKPYVFYDGPPFATGLPHHGHLVGSTLKDVVPRYQTMKGHHVSRRFGWDCHGLPIEHEINKSLKMTAQEAVKELGVAGYNQECRKIVQLYAKEWEKTIKRLGRWVDFENDYKTMDLTFMESVWWAFKELWDKDLIYQGTKVVPYSTALGTVLSNFEASENYQNIQDPSITVLFKLLDKDEKDTYVAAWTTTPWTLPSNLGLCVHPEYTYAKVFDEDKKITFIMAKDRLPAYEKKRNLTIKSEFPGKDLVGKQVEPLFDFFSDRRDQGAFQIVHDDFVTLEDGTGIVHMAPAFGEDDNRILREHKISAFVCPINDEGKFTGEVAPYSSLYFKDADKKIIQDLKEKGLLYDHSTLVHSYPFCPRSDTPLIYKAIPSWYVKVEQIKDQVLKSNEEITWVPAHIKHGRFGKWLEGARDWAISRNRVWGTPLPIWINDESGKAMCIGSRSELEGISGTKLDDLHREFIDNITFSLPGEEGTYRRVEEVLDCWFESGSMPYAQVHYPFEHKKEFEHGFPAEYIAEGLDQTRGWFYTLNILSTAIFGRPAFKNCIVNGIVKAKDGKKMSKRLKNYTAPDKLMSSYGADALRLTLINSGLVRGEEFRFSDDHVKDMVRRVLLPWYNAFKFFQTYSDVDKWNPEDHFISLADISKKGNILDQFILSKLQTLTENVNREMDHYHLYNVIPALFEFIEDLTNWYIRLNRRRFWGPGLPEDKKMAYTTLFHTLYELSALMAPFAPFLAEHIYLQLKNLGKLDAQSVHLCSYPQTDKGLIKESLEISVSKIQQIILLGRQKRNQAKIKVKTPLRTLTIIHKDQKVLDGIKILENFIQNELNIKNINYSTEENTYIKLFAKPNSPVLGKRLGKNFGKFKKLIESLKPKQLEDLEEKGTLTLEDETFASEDILIFREAKEGTNALSNRFISIDLDCQLDEELINEGLSREIINRIQKTRKELQLNVSDHIKIHYTGDTSIKNCFDKYSNLIGQETLTDEIIEKELIPSENLWNFDIEGKKLQFEIIKLT